MTGEILTFGVDIGTTYCCVAVLDNNEPKALTHGYAKTTFPSTIFVRNGVWEVGRVEITDPYDGGSFIHGTKRVLGCDSNDGQLVSDITDLNLPFELDGGQPVCKIDGETVRPEEILALFLLQANKIFEEATGKTTTKCVITVPAYFTGLQRQATEVGARIAGLEPLRIANEPTAVAVAHLWKHEVDGDLLVVDLGGGTFDLSWVRLFVSHGTRTVEVKATSGDNKLGGYDFLHMMTKEFIRIIGDGAIPYDEVRRECIAAKDRIYRHDDTSITIMIRGKTYTLEILEYRRACKQLYEKVRNAFKDLGPGLPKNVALAGGATLDPYFEHVVRGCVGDGATFLPRLPPAEVVAQGAAIIASSNIVVTEVLSRSLGIDTQDSRKGTNIMKHILRRNEAIPASFAEMFAAVDDEETEIKVFEGERKASSENNLLGAFLIATKPGQLIKVKVDVKDNSSIDVVALALEADGEQGPRPSGSLEVRRKSPLTEVEIQSMAERAQQRFNARRPVAAAPNKSKTEQKRRKRKGKDNRNRKKHK